MCGGPSSNQPNTPFPGREFWIVVRGTTGKMPINKEKFDTTFPVTDCGQEFAPDHGESAYLSCVESGVHEGKLLDLSLWHGQVGGIGRNRTVLRLYLRVALDVRFPMQFLRCVKRHPMPMRGFVSPNSRWSAKFVCAYLRCDSAVVLFWRGT
jgi:hypothetical protein